VLAIGHKVCGLKPGGGDGVLRETAHFPPEGKQSRRPHVIF
jgi:hypothetical protein